jgi:hypothetical protein
MKQIIEIVDLKEVFNMSEYMLWDSLMDLPNDEE